MNSSNVEFIGWNFIDAKMRKSMKNILGGEKWNIKN
jgi:hypothetical protein